MKSACLCVKVVGLVAVVGALNWGLVGILKLDLVATLFGEMTLASRIVYGVVGLSGLMLLVSYVAQCPTCKKEEPPQN